MRQHHKIDPLFLSNRDIGDFLKRACKKGISFKFTARGMSMAPFICDGDTITISPIVTSNVLHTGDIVAYISPDTNHLIIHRIIKSENSKYLLKGDNTYQCDGYCERQDIHGLISRIEYKNKKYDSIRFIRELFRKLGYLKKNVALLSRYKLLTPFCRLINKIFT